MNKLMILTLASMISSSAFAFEVPKDAVIKVYDAKGKEIGKMSRKDFKVVKIEEHPAPITVQDLGETYVNGYLSGQTNGVAEEQDRASKQVVYSAIVSGGVGKDGLEYNHTGVNHVVDQKNSAVGMAQLCATKNKLGLCAHATTNQFYGLGLKVDFK